MRLSCIRSAFMLKLRRELGDSFAKSSCVLGGKIILVGC